MPFKRGCLTAMATSSSDKQGNTGEGECRINVELLRKEIDNAYKMEGRPSNVSISRVPDYLKRVKKEAYVPHTLSIGPYHIRSINTPDQMERHKLAAVGRYLKRLNGKSIEFVIEEIQKLEHEIRDCYEDPITDLNAKDFAWTFTKNACFVLEFLRSLSGEKFADDSSDFVQPIFNVERLKRVLGKQLLEDILMLENQIPLFLLTKLLEMEPMGTTSSAEEKLAKLLKASLIDVASPFRISISELELVETLRNARHLLEFLKQCMTKWLVGNEKKTPSRSKTFCRSRPPFSSDSVHINSSSNSVHKFSLHPSAEILHNDGIEFKVNNTEEYGKIKIRFEKKRFGSSTLFLPTVMIKDATEIVLRNLLAFEECGTFGQTDGAISRYVFLMNSLIDSQKDVALLKKKRIIESLLGSDKEVADLLNGLCKGITFLSVDELDKAIDDVDRVYRSKIKVLMVEYIHEYIAKPWHVAGVVAATLGLLLTAVETYYSVFGQR